MTSDPKNRRVFDVFAALMKQYREDVGRVEARIKEAIDAFEREDIERLTSLANMTRTVTPKGSIRDLRGKILRVLRERGEAMTSAQIAEALYAPSLGLSLDLFRRRVIVTTSYMHKRLGTIMPCRVGGNEVYWCLPDVPAEKEPEEQFTDLLFRIGDDTETTKAALVERP